MSSNGTHDPRIILAGSAPQPLSSAQRDAQRAAMAQQLEAVTVALNQQGQAIMALRREAVAAEARVSALETLVTDLQVALAGTSLALSVAQDRIDAVERGAAVLSAWVRRPWVERVRSRMGL